MRPDEIQFEGLRDLIQKVREALAFLPQIGKKQQATELEAVFGHLPVEKLVTIAGLERFRDRFLIPYQNKFPRTPPYNFVCLVDDVIWRSRGLKCAPMV
jgi:hypothetical protein